MPLRAGRIVAIPGDCKSPAQWASLVRVQPGASSEAKMHRGAAPLLDGASRGLERRTERRRGSRGRGFCQQTKTCGRVQPGAPSREMEQLPKIEEEKNYQFE